MENATDLYLRWDMPDRLTYQMLDTLDSVDLSIQDIESTSLSTITTCLEALDLLQILTEASLDLIQVGCELSINTPLKKTMDSFDLKIILYMTSELLSSLKISRDLVNEELINKLGKDKLEPEASNKRWRKSPKKNKDDTAQSQRQKEKLKHGRDSRHTGIPINEDTVSLRQSFDAEMLTCFLDDNSH